MNQYGREAQEYWQANLSARYRALEDPEVFFTDLGEQVLGQVLELSTQLQGKDTPEEEGLDKLRRLTAAKRQAEEIVKNDLVYLPPEANLEDLDALREEWESARAEDAAMLRWAEQFWLRETQPLQDEIEEQAAYWMLPVTFFQEIAGSENASEIYETAEPERKLAADRRFQRWLDAGADLERIYEE